MAKQPNYTARLTIAQSSILAKSIGQHRVQQLEANYHSIAKPAESGSGTITIQYGNRVPNREKEVYEVHGNLDNRLISGQFYPEYETINFYFV